MRILSLSLLFVVIIQGGCVTGPEKVQYSPMVSQTLSPKNPTQVKVYQTKEPKRNYIEIGILEYREGTAENLSEVVEHFRVKAAQIGADGLIMMGTRSGPSLPIGGLIANLNDYQAMAIKFRK